MSVLKRNNKRNKSEKKQGESWFFGIGINEYQHFSKLNNAVRDVEDLISLLVDKYDLEKENIHTLFNTEATREKIINKLDDLDKLIRRETKGKPTDKLIIYYSGHGYLNEDKQGYWIPVDAERDRTARYIPNSTIRDHVLRLKTLHTLLISDSCFSGSLFVPGPWRSSTAADKLEKKVSRWAFCSGREDEEVEDGSPGGNSPFAKSILDVLGNNDEPKLHVGRFIDQVMVLTGSEAEGQLAEGNPLRGVGHRGGQYVFRLKSDKGSDEESVWEAVKEINIMPRYEEFIEQFPDGKYKTHADEKMKLLEDQEAELWRKTKAEDTPTAYRKYLEFTEKISYGKHRKGAERRKKELIYLAEEEELWRKTKKMDTIDAYLEYKCIANSRHHDEEADKRINELKPLSSYSVEDVIHQFINGNSHAKEIAILNLSDIGTREAIDYLTSIVKNDDQDTSIRDEALTALIQDIPENTQHIAFTNLTTTFSEIPNYLQSRILDYIKKTQKLNLVTTLKNNPNPKVVLAAIDALENMVLSTDLSDKEEILNLLSELTIHQNEDVACAAIEAKKNIRPSTDFVELLDRPSLKVVLCAIKALGNSIPQLGQEENQKIIDPLVKKASLQNPEVAIASIETLEKAPHLLKKSHIEQLSTCLGSSDASLKMATSRLLGETQHPRAHRYLSVLLSDKDFYVLQTVASSMFNIDPERTYKEIIKEGSSVLWKLRGGKLIILYDVKTKVPKLIALLAKDDADQGLREFIMEILGATKDEKAVELLLEALNDKDAKVREGVAVALGKIRDVKAIEPLLEILNDKDANVRRRVTEALGILGGDKVFTPLKEALKDKDFNVRKEAAMALGKTRNIQAVESLIDALKDKETEVRKEAAAALSQFRVEKAVELLIKAFNIQDINVRVGVAKALGKIGDKQAVKPLLDVLNDNDDNANVREATIVALGEIGSKKAVQPLIDILGHEDFNVRQIVIKTLSSFLKDTTLKKLLSQDFDNINPWIDTNTIIDENRIIEASQELDLEVEEIKKLYAELNIFLDGKLKFEWGKEEPLEIPKETMKSPKNHFGFHTYLREDGLYCFQFQNFQDTPILFSRGYQTEKSRDYAIKSVIRNAGEDSFYEIKRTQKGQHFFILKATNHKEIGRSRIFDTKEEMEEKRTLLKAIKKDVPIFDITGIPTEKEESQEIPKATIQPATDLPEKKERPGIMMRYKFSIIYYPDAKAWQIKYDASGDVLHLKTFNCGQIEEFLKAHLPDEQKSAVSTSDEEKSVSTKATIHLTPDLTMKKESAEIMPRYKFSIIFYPDTNVWHIKYDLSGSSLPLKTFNCGRVKEFLKANLPVEKNLSINSKKKSMTQSEFIIEKQNDDFHFEGSAQIEIGGDRYNNNTYQIGSSEDNWRVAVAFSLTKKKPEANPLKWFDSKLYFETMGLAEDPSTQTHRGEFMENKNDYAFEFTFEKGSIPPGVYRLALAINFYADQDDSFSLVSGFADLGLVQVYKED